MSELGIIEDGAVLCSGGKIVAAGKARELLKHSWFKKNKKKVRELDCRRGVLLPGFVDAHTHPAFISPRLVDFEKRISGATYEEIAEAGGGIRSSIAGVRKASRNELSNKILTALDEMAGCGTTTVEAKSGYGLSVESEIKSLEAIRDAARRWPGTVVSTLLGAHVVPAEFRENPDEYTRVVCDEMIPLAAKRKLASFVDVFCERGAFSLGDTERILAAAGMHGFATRAHVCQLTECQLASLLSYHPASLDHLDHIGDADVARVAKTDTIATLVPGANYFLGLASYPPARKLIEAGAAVCVATDYNPGTSPTVSMSFVLSLACTQMKMSPAEAIVAATINGAHSLRLARSKGSIEPGKDADLAVFDASDYREISYWFGSSRCFATVLQGHVRDSV